MGVLISEIRLSGYSLLKLYEFVIGNLELVDVSGGVDAGVGVTGGVDAGVLLC